jgi:hypothetical protein
VFTRIITCGGIRSISRRKPRCCACALVGISPAMRQAQHSLLRDRVDDLATGLSRQCLEG